MNCRPIFLKITFWLLLVAIGTSAQERFTCDDARVQIGEISSDSAHYQIMTSRLLEDKRVLQPIKLSQSDIEIRFFFADLMPGDALVIKCERDSFKMTQYIVRNVPVNTPPSSYKHFRDLGVSSAISGYKVILRTVESNNPRGKKNWAEFFFELTKNSFFKAPTEKELHRKVIAMLPHVEEKWGGSFLTEVKVGNDIRSSLYNKRYIPAPLQVKEYRQKVDILNLVESQLLHNL